MATDLVCPKCQGHMRAYERSGVTVDQCADCRGIFLDRGELEHLVDAEQGWQRSHSAPAPSDRYERDRALRRRRSRRYGQSSQKKRKKSFFDDLFD